MLYSTHCCCYFSTYTFVLTSHLSHHVKSSGSNQPVLFFSPISVTTIYNVVQHSAFKYIFYRKRLKQKTLEPLSLPSCPHMVHVQLAVATFCHQGAAVTHKILCGKITLATATAYIASRRNSRTDSGCFTWRRSVTILIWPFPFCALTTEGRKACHLCLNSPLSLCATASRPVGSCFLHRGIRLIGILCGPQLRHFMYCSHIDWISSVLGNPTPHSSPCSVS